MNYKEFTDSNDYFRKEWRNKAGHLHREDGPAQIYYYCDDSIEWEEFAIAGKMHRDSGPAQIWYNPDGTIYCEGFYLYGEFLGYEKVGFWTFWERLTEDGRQAPEILKYLVRYS